MAAVAAAAAAAPTRMLHAAGWLCCHMKRREGMRGAGGCGGSCWRETERDPQLNPSNPLSENLTQS